MKVDYSIHEQQYRQLKEEKFEGWGKEKFEERVQGSVREIESFMKLDSFPDPGSKVLELGCGTGEILRVLAARGYEVFGVDISETAVEWAREKFAKNNLQGRFFSGSISDLHFFEDRQFDAVIDGNCLHCLIGGDRKLAFKEVHRILRLHGFFHLSSMIGEPKQPTEGTIWDPNIRCQVLDDETCYRYMNTADGLLCEVESMGFEIIHKSVTENPWWDHQTIASLKI